MQINRTTTSSVVSDNKTKQPNVKRENTTFKGLGPVDTIALGVADAIENGGLAVSFTLQDMLGTNLPRPIMGLTRNSKENKGEKNLKFAAKEMVREFTTGPSMFLIPLGMLAAGKKVIGATINTPAAFIKSFGEIHSKNPVDAAGNAISKEGFFKNTFTEIIKNAKAEKTASDATIATAEDFAKRLSDAVQGCPKGFLEKFTPEARAKKKALGETIGKLSGEFIDIAKKHADDAVYTDFTKATVSKNASDSFKNTVGHMMEYADDVIVKAKNMPTEKAVKNIVNKQTALRFGANIAMYAAVMTFLQVIPKMYNKAEGKGNAGLKGLMAEEMFNDSADSKKPTKNDKSNPSFGSAASFTKTVADKVTGSGLLGKIGRTIEFQGPNVSFPLLVGIMTFGILGPRVKNSKDKYDRQEIMRRDVTTCAVMCYGEKALRKGFSKANELNSGLVVATKPENLAKKSILGKVFDYIRPIKGVNVMNSQQIVSKYSGLDKYKDGISVFCEFIDKQGGNLKKVFSLTDESKGIVGSLLKKEGKNLETADNKVIKEVLGKAKDSEEVKKLADLFKGTTKETNPWIKKAQTMNARFTALSVLVLVPAFLGFMLPWINEKSTKKQINEELSNKNKDANNMTAKITNPKFENAKYFISNAKPDNVFADMKSSAFKNYGRYSK